MILAPVLKDRQSCARCEGQWFSQSIDRTGTGHPDTKLPCHLEKKGKGRALREWRDHAVTAEIEAIHSNPELAEMSLGARRERLSEIGTFTERGMRNRLDSPGPLARL